MKEKKIKSWLKNNIPTFRSWQKGMRYLLKRPKWFFHRNVLKNSIFMSDFELPEASLFPQKTLDQVIKMFHPQSVLDLGCGTGKALEYFYRQGVKVVGVDGSHLAISKAAHPDCMICYNLEKELDLKKKFDLIWSYEFVEHIHPRYIQELLKTFSNHADTVIVSAASPGQGGDGHFNEQPARYWIKQFRAHGYVYNQRKTDMLRAIKEYYNDNILVFER